MNIKQVQITFPKTVLDQVEGYALESGLDRDFLIVSLMCLGLTVYQEDFLQNTLEGRADAFGPLISEEALGSLSARSMERLTVLQAQALKKCGIAGTVGNFGSRGNR